MRMFLRYAMANKIQVTFCVFSLDEIYNPFLREGNVIIYSLEVNEESHSFHHTHIIEETR